MESMHNKHISDVQRHKWREKYLTNRYLGNLPEDDLRRRFDDILLNLLVFSGDGSPSFDQASQMQGLVERLIHLDEEMSQRGTPIAANFLEDASRYLYKYQNIQHAIKAWGNRKPVMGAYLVKFSKKIYITQMNNTGIIRVNPASFYDDPSLNQAIQDRELSQTLVLPRGTKLKKQIDSDNYEEIKGIRSISLTKHSPTDFYVYCMTKLYNHRLFDDFEADACLLIYDVNKFLKKFLDYLKEDYYDWLIQSKEVHYQDPFFPTATINIPFNKHFRFWYQSEFRIVFKPRNHINKLEPIDIEIGSLNDCCELIHL